MLAPRHSRSFRALLGDFFRGAAPLSRIRVWLAAGGEALLFAASVSLCCLLPATPDAD